MVQSTGRETVREEGGGQAALRRRGGEGDDRRTPNGQVAARGQRRAGAPFSRRAGQGRQRTPESSWRMVFRAEGQLTAMTPNPMDSAVGRISRTSDPVDARVTAEHDPLWNFKPLCVWGGCTDSREGWPSRFGIIRIFKTALHSGRYPDIVVSLRTF